ncbi:MAG: aminopeptidase P family protein [Bacteroidia bacterium]|nr:aminopeptidase P family protein [Bacteroidia bacterium]
MFDPKTYIHRRNQLRNKFHNGLILIMGNSEVPMNYSANTYHFRQDSTFLYFFGLDMPGLAGILDVDESRDYIFGNDTDIDDIIWMGPQPGIKDIAANAGVKYTGPFGQLHEAIGKAIRDKRKIYFLPPYRAENKILLEELLGFYQMKLKNYASEELIKAVVELRSIKEPQEVREIEACIDVAHEMFETAMKMAKDGVVESRIAGVMEGIALKYNGYISFPVILSIHGETLHNHYHGNTMKNGDLLLIDAGAESPGHYATDHTRTIPVGGKFLTKQREIYQIVLDAQEEAIKAIRPGVTYQSIHMLACKAIVNGLKGIGLMKGDTEEAVIQGAHTLFFPHGLGHMMGLDVHDMEDLGEDYVGYDEETKRVNQFGTGYLRLGRRLKEGFVVTAEPGIYFIPALIDLWKKDKKFAQFINYEKLKEYKTFGGIRIEDDILVTKDGHRVLGKPILKAIDDIESLMVFER